MIYQIDFNPTNSDFAIASNKISIYRVFSNKNQKEEVISNILSNKNGVSNYELLYSDNTISPVYTVRYSMCGKYIAYGGKDGAVILLDSNSFNLLEIFQFSGGFVETIAFSNDNRYILISGQGGIIQIESISKYINRYSSDINSFSTNNSDSLCNKKTTFTKKISNGFISSAVFLNRNSDSKYYFYTSGADNIIRYFYFSESETIKLISEIDFSKFNSWITTITVLENRNLLLVGFSDGLIFYKSEIGSYEKNIINSNFKQLISVKIFDETIFLFIADNKYIYKHTIQLLESDFNNESIVNYNLDISSKLFFVDSSDFKN